MEPRALNLQTKMTSIQLKNEIYFIFNVGAFKLNSDNLSQTLQTDSITSITCNRSCLSYLSLRGSTADKKRGWCSCLDL